MDDSPTHVTVTDGVKVGRTIEDRSPATVVVYRLQTRVSTPRVVHLEEAIPPEECIETLDFHPNYLPNDWTMDDGAVQFDAVVPPNETRLVVLGVDATDDEPLGRDEPTISQSDLEASDLSESSDGLAFERNSTESTDDDRSGDFDMGPLPVADGSDTVADPDSDEMLDPSDPTTDESDTPAEGPAQLPDSDGEEPAEPVLSGDGMGGGGGVADDDTGAVAGDDGEIGGDGGVVDAVGDGADAEEPPEASAGGESAAEPDGAESLDGTDVGSPPAEGGESLVSDLLAEIRAGHATEDELDALRSELGVARTDGVRLSHVQSRMDDFEAYVEALEGIINTHGTASEFVDRIEREVTDINDELGTVRSEVRTVEEALESAEDDREALTDGVDELKESLAGVSDEVAELTDLVESVEDRTDILETELREELETVREEREEELDRLETELEDVREQLEDDFETEVDSLREDVESLEEVRRSLRDAFGGGLEPTTEDETTEE